MQIFFSNLHKILIRKKCFRMFRINLEMVVASNQPSSRWMTSYHSNIKLELVKLFVQLSVKAVEVNDKNILHSLN